MKFFVFTKQRLLVLGCCIIAAVLSVSICMSSYNKVVETAAASDRIIPIYNVDTDKKQVSISFDAAWGNEQTQALLDTLEKYNIKTTFFLVGQWVNKYPDSVKAISDAGHDIGNHSSTHSHMPKLTAEAITKEIEDCNNAVEEITGKSPTLFRAPYGDYNNCVVSCVKDLSMYCVQWNIDSLDWKDLPADQICARIKKGLCPGSIILLHNGAKHTPEALPQIIECIESEGYEIVPISELLLKGEYKTDGAGKMIAADEPEKSTVKNVIEPITTNAAD